jgi:3',5'-cyclic AMP phosphodiesterase CpdA
MTSSMHPRLAVIADAHFHDPDAGYGLAEGGEAAGPTGFRRLAETARSLRVFNESRGALEHTLDDIVARQIKHVILLGDYSDDGQIATLAGLRRILERYSAKSGLRFYATVGNHDIFGQEGRHRTKRILNAAGGYDIVTSNPALRDAEAGQVHVCGAMYCQGYPKGLQAMPDVGFFGASTALHWETPFVQGASLDGRAPGQSRMDASYLIEPFDGVWLLMIDANVFRPLTPAELPLHDEKHADSAAAGWNAMLSHKAFILEWMGDVARRAQSLGKQLLTFSHYPVLDPLAGTGLQEEASLRLTGFAGRIPGPDVGRAMINCGITTHFSGHLHVNDTARYRQGDGFIVNVSVPSLVAFPSAYKIIDIDDTALKIETVAIADMPLNPKITARYDMEILQTGLKAGGLADCTDYGDFLYEHIGHLVARRHLRRDWPQDLAAIFHNTTLADLTAIAMTGAACLADDLTPQLAQFRTPSMTKAIAKLEAQAGLAEGALAEIPALSFLKDWYRLRMGRDFAQDRLRKTDLQAYRLVAGLFAGLTTDAGSLQERLALVFTIFTKYLTGLPSRNFSIDLQSGKILRQ